MPGRSPSAIDSLQGLGDVPAIQLDDHEPGRARVDVIHRRVDVVADRAQGEVVHDADHLRGAAHRSGRAGLRDGPARPSDGLADSVLGSPEPEPLRGRLVQHDIRQTAGRPAGVSQQDVLTPGRIEESARQRLEALDFEELEVDGAEMHDHRRAAGRAGLRGFDAAVHNKAGRAGDALHARQVGDVLPQRGLAGRGDSDHLVGVEPERLIQSEGGLPIDRRRHDDQPDQDRELDHDQRLADSRRAG